MKQLFTFFFMSILLFVSQTVSAQDNYSEIQKKYKGPYIDASFGFFPNPPEEFTIHARASLSAGFQYHHFAIGLEGLSASRGNAYSSTKFSGYGLQLKYTPKHFLAHFSVGKTMNGDHVEDNSFQWTYKNPAGNYFKFGGAYRFAGGALYTGMSFIRVKNINFDLQYDDGNSPIEIPDEDRMSDFMFTLDLGFTFPGKR